MPTAPRKLDITYGSLKIGKDTPRVVDDEFSFSLDPNNGFLEASFVVVSGTESGFNALVSGVEAPLRTPFLGLTASQDGTPFFSHPVINASPEISKRQELADSAFSRRYFVRFTFELEADVHALSGRRESRFDIAKGPGDERLATVTGTWTRITGAFASAREQYEANIDAFTSSILSPLGTFELIEDAFDADTKDVTGTFRRVHREVIDDQSSAGLDDPDIRNHSVSIARVRTNPGDSPEFPTERLAQIRVTYTASVKKGVNIVTKYTTALRSFLIARALRKYGAGIGAVVDLQVDPNDQTRTLTVSITILALVAGNSLLQSRITRAQTDDKGKVILGIWDPNPLAGYVFQGERKLVFTTTITDRVLAGTSGPFDQVQADPALVLISEQPSVMPLRLGTPQNFIDVEERSLTRIERRVDPPTGGPGETRAAEREGDERIGPGPGDGPNQAGGQAFSPGLLPLGIGATGRIFGAFGAGPSRSLFGGGFRVFSADGQQQAGGFAD